MPKIKCNRVSWIDSARGGAIFLVVFGHCITRMGIGSSTVLNVLIYSFHMPLFFILAGMTLKTEDRFKDFLKGKIRHVLLWTYFFLGVKTLVLSSLSFVFSSNVSLLVTVPVIIRTAFCYRDSSISEWWFLPTLFISQLIIYVATKIKNRYISGILALGCLIFNGIYTKYVNVALPFCTEEALIAVIFVYIGFYYRNVIYDSMKNLKNIVFSIIIWLLTLTVRFYLGQGMISMWNSQIGNTILFFICAFSGSLVAIGLFIRIENMPIIKSLGRNSLWIFGYHYVLLDIFSKVVEKYTWLKGNNTVINVTILLIISIFIIMLINSSVLLLERLKEKLVYQ